MNSQNIDPARLSTQQRLALIRQGEAVLKARPGDAAMMYQLAMLYYSENRLGDAAELLRKAHKQQKRNADIVNALLAVYQRMQDHPNTIRTARKLVEMRPREEKPLLALAEALQSGGKMQSALETWQKATKLFSGNVDNWRCLAECHRILGDMDSAKQVYEKIAEFAPYDAQTLYLAANSGKLEENERSRLLERIAVSIGQTEDPLYAANLHYAAGKLHDDEGDHDLAFDFYSKANQIQPRIDSEKRIQREFDNAMAAFTRETVRKCAAMGHPSRDPIFILGMPRSGTTLVESLAGAHPQIVAGDEMRYMAQVAENLGQDRAEALRYAGLINSLTARDLNSIGEQYLASAHAQAGTAGRFTDKLPHNFMQIGIIRCVFPNAGIIHCRRHPVDNCLSLFTNSMTTFHNSYKYDLKTLGLYYQRYLTLMEHWREAIPDGFHEIFYEDIVANTEWNARSMISYLGLDWDDAVMQREGAQKSVRTLSAWQVRQPVYKTSAGRWRRYEKHLAPLIDALGDSIQEYEDSLERLSREKQS